MSLAPAESKTDLENPPPGVGDFYEVADGVFEEPPEMSVFEVWLANRLVAAINEHFAANGKTGQVVHEMLFRLDPSSRQQRRPDLAYVSFERWAEGKLVPRRAFWDVVPDLAVEVVSPSDVIAYLERKIREYFRAGVRCVWVFNLDGSVDVYRSPHDLRVVPPDGELDGGDVLPGFRVRLVDLVGRPPEDSEAEPEEPLGDR